MNIKHHFFLSFLLLNGQLVAMNHSQDDDTNANSANIKLTFENESNVLESERRLSKSSTSSKKHLRNRSLLDSCEDFYNVYNESDITNPNVDELINARLRSDNYASMPNIEEDSDDFSGDSSRKTSNGSERSVSSHKCRPSIFIDQQFRKKSITTPNSPRDKILHEDMYDMPRKITKFAPYSFIKKNPNLTARSYSLIPRESCNSLTQLPGKSVIEDWQKELNSEKSKIQKKIYEIQKEILDLETKTKNWQDGARKYLIITLDGGGSRGIVEILFLRDLIKSINDKRSFLLDKLNLDVRKPSEEAVSPKKGDNSVGKSISSTDKKILQTRLDAIDRYYCLKFDMLAGTSVGALIGMGCVLGKLDKIYDNYNSLVNEIFYPKRSSFFALRGPKYRSDHKKVAFKEYVGSMTGKELKLEKHVDFIVPYFSVHTKEPVVYRNYVDPDMSLLDLAMATSAAPTYFNPYKVKTSRGTQPGVDGGIFANHPGMIAYFEAISRYKNATKISMISLGTGYESVPDKKEHHNRGLLFWAKNVIDMAMTATSNLNNTLLGLADKSDEKFDYLRLQLGLDKNNAKLDNKKPENFENIENAYKNAINASGALVEPFRQAEDIIFEYLDQFVEFEVNQKKIELLNRNKRQLEDKITEQERKLRTLKNIRKETEKAHAIVRNSFVRNKK